MQQLPSQLPSWLRLDRTLLLNEQVHGIAVSPNKLFIACISQYVHTSSHPLLSPPPNPTHTLSTIYNLFFQDSLQPGFNVHTKEPRWPCQLSSHRRLLHFREGRLGTFIGYELITLFSTSSIFLNISKCSARASSTVLGSHQVFQLEWCRPYQSHDYFTRKGILFILQFTTNKVQLYFASIISM